MASESSKTAAKRRQPSSVVTAINLMSADNVNNLDIFACVRWDKLSGTNGEPRLHFGKKNNSMISRFEIMKPGTFSYVFVFLYI